MPDWPQIVVMWYFAIVITNYPCDDPEQDGSARYQKTLRREERADNKLKMERLWEDRRDGDSAHIKWKQC